MAYKDPEKQRAFQRDWQKHLRLFRRAEVIRRLGGKCEHCLSDDIRVLQIDHRIPLLRSNRDERATTSGQGLVASIFRGVEPLEKFQLLCANCHCIKTQDVDAGYYYSKS